MSDKINQAETDKSNPDQSAAATKAEAKTDSAEAKHSKKTKPVRHTKTGKANVLVFVIAVVAVAGTGINYWLLQQALKSTASLADSQAKQATQFNHLNDQLQSTNNKLADITSLQKNSQAEQDALKHALELLRESLGQSTIAWKLAELDYLLSEASYHLTINQDSKTALAIYETADERIKAIGDPALLKVRKAIADEITQLRSIDLVDITGLSIRLASLSKNISDLPLVDKQRIITAVHNEPDKEIESWQEIPKRIWEDLKSLVQVRRHQQPIEPLLPPQQTEFLYQNLQLKLEQARLALVRQDTKLFHHDVELVLQWVNSFFDNNSSSVQQLKTQLEEFLKVDLVQNLPDGSRPLRALHAVAKEIQQISTGDSPA